MCVYVCIYVCKYVSTYMPQSTRGIHKVACKSLFSPSTMLVLVLNSGCQASQQVLLSTEPFCRPR